MYFYTYTVSYFNPGLWYQDPFIDKETRRKNQAQDHTRKPQRQELDLPG